MTTTESDKRLEQYEKHVLDALHAASRDYDQAVLAVAGGTLALSATFANAVALEAGDSKTLLFLAWTALVVAIVAVVASFQTSQAVLRAYVERRSSPHALGRATSGLNILSGVSLVVGLALLSAFAFINL
jgi:hypothetical protein